MDINASIRKISILERKLSGANNNWHITLSYNNDIVEAKGSTVEEAWESALAFADVFLGYSVEYTCPFDDRGRTLPDFVDNDKFSFKHLIKSARKSNSQLQKDNSDSLMSFDELISY